MINNMSPQSVKSPNPASGVQSPPGTSHHQTSASVVTGGIQAILEAEKEAQAIIEKARQCIFCVICCHYYCVVCRQNSAIKGCSVGGHQGAGTIEGSQE